MMFLCLKSFNDVLIQTYKLRMFNEDSKALNSQVTDYLLSSSLMGLANVSTKIQLESPE